MSWLYFSTKKQRADTDFSLLVPYDKCASKSGAAEEPQQIFRNKSRLSETSDISSDTLSVNAKALHLKRHRLSFLMRKQKRSVSSPMPALKKTDSSNETSARLKRATTSPISNIKVVPSKNRFKQFIFWKTVFEPERGSNGSSQEDFFESWMVKRFFSLARPRIRRKVMLLLLEKISLVFSLVEEEARKHEEDKMSLMVNSLNGYLLSLRFGVSKVSVKTPVSRKKHIFEMKTINRKTMQETIKSSIAVVKENIKHFKLSANEIEKRRVNLTRMRKKKSKSNIKLLKLQESAIDNFYESLILYVIEMKQTSQSQGKELTIDTLSSSILSKFQMKLEAVLDANKATLLASVSNILLLPKLRVLRLFLNKGTLENKLEEVIEFLKVSISGIIQVLNEDHLKSFLNLANAKDLFTKQWRVDTVTSQLIFNETDIALKQDLKASFENLYIQLEHIIVHFTDWAVKHLEKLLA